MEWQPIETAPKDGTEVLVHDEGCVLIAFWSDDEQAWIDHGPMVPPPQHWMPLPSPPGSGRGHLTAYDRFVAFFVRHQSLVSGYKGWEALIGDKPQDTPVSQAEIDGIAAKQEGRGGVDGCGCVYVGLTRFPCERHREKP